MKPRSILCLLIAVAAFLGAGCNKKEAPNASATQPDSGSAKPTNPEPALPTVEGQAFSETVVRLTKQKQTQKLSAEESFELAVGLFATGKFPEALAVATEGKDLTKDKREKSLFHIIISQCYGAKGDYRAAAKTALEGQNINSQSVELAALRYAYFTKVEDSAQIKAAEDMLKQFEPSGQPVLSAGQFIGVITLAGKIISACTAIYKVVDGAWTQIRPQVEQLATTLKALWTKGAPGGASLNPDSSSPR